ncbi:MAG: hypothetical protein A2W33_02815 [Chloroflexi bacterium RBG_16_52_11]|nr:MAG: hypothetical protein A2W33_02815 [Chloroflexi bacterium RBG_16_52_11]
MPESLTIKSTTFQQSGKWNLHHPYADPSAPELITVTSDGYGLDPDFQVASIDLVYRWVGIGDRVREYQRIERLGDGFWHRGTVIAASAVSKLIQSIVHLHPEPQVLSSTTHTDDYPFWAIELADSKGNTVLLYSESNAPNFAPWNVVYNGAIYAQFDGQIATALPDLFDIAQGQTMAAFWWREWEPGYLTVVPAESARSISSGFSGLLPLYWDFFYAPDAQNGELSGNISGIDWSADVGDMTFNWLSDLQTIELVVDDGQTMACTFDTSIETDSDLVGVTQHFICPVGKPGASQAYSYPIRLTYTDPANQTYALSGKLFGYWEGVTVLPTTPYPEEIGKILESSPVWQDLLSDHQIEVLHFVGAADPATGMIDHHWKADVALFGQVQFTDRILPYSVTIRNVVIEGSKPIHWDIDRSELEVFLQDVLDQPITRRFMEADLNLVLNLYYEEVYGDPLIREEYLAACADLPAPRNLPSPGQPLRGFCFNQPREFYGMQILLMEDGLRIYDLDISPSSPEDAFWATLLPSALQPQGASPFREIFTRLGGQGVSVYWAEDASDSEVRQYNTMFESWGVQNETKDHGIFFPQMMFGFTPDGRLTLINCQAP